MNGLSILKSYLAGAGKIFKGKDSIICCFSSLEPYSGPKITPSSQFAIEICVFFFSMLPQAAAEKLCDPKYSKVSSSITCPSYFLLTIMYLAWYKFPSSF